MCICDYKAFLRLTKNFVESYDGNNSAFYQIAKNITRTDRRKLVGVADKYKTTPERQSTHHTFKYIGINHRHFVNNKRVTLKLIALVFVKHRIILLIPADFKHTMQGFGFIPCNLAHSLCGSPSWC